MMVSLEAFSASLTDPSPPPGLTKALEGLWWDAKGDWTRAHECAQAQDDPAGNRVHAYLHRKEGDLPNAKYWYARAGQTMPAGALEAEWETVLREMLMA
jgi:hypothetical protein